MLMKMASSWPTGSWLECRAIRQKQEVRFLADIEKLAKRIALGRLRTAAKIYEAIGRLKERYPRVARYYHMAYDEQQSELSFSEDVERKQKAESLDSSYLLKSSRSDLSAEDIWRTYVLLSRVEAAFRAMKSPVRATHLPPVGTPGRNSYLFVCAGLPLVGLY